MGWIKNAKADMNAAEARKAVEAGHSVLAVVLNSPATRADLSGHVEDWSLSVAAIEAEGWQLTNWTVGQDPKGRPQAYPLFRRQVAGMGGGAPVGY